MVVIYNIYRIFTCAWNCLGLHVKWGGWLKYLPSFVNCLFRSVRAAQMREWTLKSQVCLASFDYVKTDDLFCIQVVYMDLTHSDWYMLPVCNMGTVLNLQYCFSLFHYNLIDFCLSFHVQSFLSLRLKRLKFQNHLYIVVFPAHLIIWMGIFLYLGFRLFFVCL